MAYREKSTMDVWEVIRRWHDRQSIRDIARSTGYARRTVQCYVRLGLSFGLSPEKPLPEKEAVIRLLHGAAQPLLGRSPQAQTLLLPHLDEINDLINPPERKDLALKPKTAFTVICERYPSLVTNISYTSYKRFIRIHKLTFNPSLVTCRIEVEPGMEVQIDYARVGRLLDPRTGHLRNLYVFIGTLSHSRMKYVELTFSQDQKSFASSHVRMFEFFGGVPRKTIIDNLKSGIVKPDLYDPTLNRSYAEVIEHYGTFVDPARVRHPKDKGKVERDVQTVREEARKEMVQHPQAGVAELNRLMNGWSLSVYGQREHGTTGEKPYTVFIERERPALKALPEKRLELAEWKQATVHPDHYIQFRGKAYSMPHAYVGRTIWIKATEYLLRAFFRDELIKQHIITPSYRHTDNEDFPANFRAVLDRNFIHKNLLDRASKISPSLHQMIGELFEVHAYINLRNAQGMVTTAEATQAASPKGAALVERAASFMSRHHIKATSRNFRTLMVKLEAETSTPNLLPLSAATNEFLREINYFIK
jgi:transposase